MAQNIYAKNENTTGNGCYGAQFDPYTNQDYVASDDQNGDEIIDEYDGISTDYPIGDGQGITGERYAGDYSLDEDGPPHFKLNKNCVPITEKKILSKSYPPNTIPAQYASRRYTGSMYPRSYHGPMGRYGHHNIGDYVDYNARPLPKPPNYYPKSDAANISSLAYSNKYTQYKPDCLLRRVCRNEMSRQGTHAAPLTRGTTYSPEITNLTHEQLKNAFVERYEIDQRKLAPSRASVPNRACESKQLPTPRLVTSENRVLPRRISSIKRTDQIKITGETATKITSSQTSPRNETKCKSQQEEQNNQPNRHNLEKKDTDESMKVYPQFQDRYAYRQLMKEQNEKTPPDDSDLELKYKNSDFHGNDVLKEDLYNNKESCYQECGAEPSSVCESSITNEKNDMSSDDKICLSENVNTCKVKNSARSGRSKTASMSKRHFTNLINLERSKCNVLSVIDDGLSRIEQSRNDCLCTPKSGKSSCTKTSHRHSSDVHTEESKDKSFSSSLDIVRSDFMHNMFKEYRGYHLENMKQEIKRIQYLDSLPEKWVKEKFSSNI